MIETKRTYIREFEIEDGPGVLAFSRDQLVTRFTGDAGLVTNLDEAKAVITQVWKPEYKQYGYGRWAVVHKESGQVMGFCGFKHDKKLAMPDMGYRFLPQFWGKGYASETASACVDYGQKALGIEAFFGDVMPENIASIKVLEKLGLKFSHLIQEDGVSFMRFT